MGKIAKLRQKSDKIWFNIDMILKWQFSEGYRLKFEFENIFMLKLRMWIVIILWSFYIQNMDIISFFTQNLNLHNIILILCQFDSKIVGFV
jgi:hypothetical protein